jgi:hypothetical protein
MQALARKGSEGEAMRMYHEMNNKEQERVYTTPRPGLGSRKGSWTGSDRAKLDSGTVREDAEEGDGAAAGSDLSVGKKKSLFKRLTGGRQRTTSTSLASTSEIPASPAPSPMTTASAIDKGREKEKVKYIKVRLFHHRWFRWSQVLTFKLPGQGQGKD